MTERVSLGYVKHSFSKQKSQLNGVASKGKSGNMAILKHHLKVHIPYKITGYKDL